MGSKTKLLLEVDILQRDTIEQLFTHNDWNFEPLDLSEVQENEVKSGADSTTQTFDEHTGTSGDETEVHFHIMQDISKEECPYCLCRPCITSEENRQYWWETENEVPNIRNSCIRKDKYQRFWAMLLHRGVWNDQRYIAQKNQAMENENRRQRLEWHKRDIMPKCVVELVRTWLPNPKDVPYMGHMWD